MHGSRRAGVISITPRTFPITSCAVGAAGALLFVLAGIAGVTHADKVGGNASRHQRHDDGAALLQRSGRRHRQGWPEGSAGARVPTPDTTGGAAGTSPAATASSPADAGTAADRCRAGPQVVRLV